MTAFSFPINPSVGQEYQQPDGSLYTWSGYAWISNGSSNDALLEARMDKLEAGLNRKADLWGDVRFNTVHANGEIVAFYEDPVIYAIAPSINFMDCTIVSVGSTNASKTSQPGGIYYMGDAVEGVPDVLACKITGTPDYATAQWKFNFTAAYGTGTWTYGDAAATTDTAGTFTYPAAGDYPVTFVSDTDGFTSHMTLSVLDADPVVQISPDEIAVPGVAAIPEGFVETSNGNATYTYPRPGYYTIRYVPTASNSIGGTAEVHPYNRTDYPITAAVRFDVCNLSVSPPVSGVYDMGDAIAEQAAVNKNRITATPDPTPVPYMYTFAIEGAAAGTWTYGNAEATTDATGVFTYVGPGTYAVTFTDGTSGIVSNLSLVVADGDTVAQTGAIEEISPYVPPSPTHTVISDENGNATYSYTRAGDFTITFTPDDGNYATSTAVNIIMPTLYTITCTRSEMTGTFTTTPGLPGTYYFGDGVAEIPEVPATYQPHITATPNRTDNGDGTFTPGTPYMWTFAIEDGAAGTWSYGDPAATVDANGTFTYPAVGTYEVSFTHTDGGAVSNLSLIVADGDTAAQVSANQEITPLVPAVPAIPEGTLVSTDGLGTYLYPREGTYTVRYAPDDGNDNPTTTCIAHTSVPYVISSPEYFMYKALSLAPTCGGYYDMGDYVAEVPEVPATYKNKITATPDATIGADGVTPEPVPYKWTFSVENAPAGSYSYGDAVPTVDALAVFTYPGPGTYAVTFTDSTTGVVSNLSLVVDDAPVAQTGVAEELTPYAPVVPAIPAGRVDTTDGTAEYTYPRVGDYTITFYPNELSLPVTLAVSAIERTTYTISTPRDECTATLSSSPALPGVYYFGDSVPEVPEVPATYKAHIAATPLYDPVPLTFTFDTGVPGLYAFGDVEATTDDSPNGVSQMTYTVAGTYSVTFTETSTAAVSTLSLIVPDVDPVAQTSPDEILTDVVPAVPAIPEGTLVSADGTGSYVYPREGTYTIRYVPDDHNYEATSSFIAHTSIPYVISSPEYFLYKTLSLSPTCGGQYRMGDGVAEVVGVYKAHIIATPDATLGADGVTPEPVPYKFTFTNDGVTAFSRSIVKVGTRSIRQLKAKKSARSAGSYSYGDPAATVDTTGVFTYPAAGTYTVTFTDDVTGAVSTLALNVLDTGNIQQISDNDWYVVPAPAIPEGVVTTTDGIAEYTYPRPGDYTITFEPNELSKPVTLAVTAPARTEYSIVAMRDERIATLASAPALPGTYYFGDAVAEIPEVPATYGLQVTATPDYANGQWKYNFSNNKGLGGTYAFGDPAGSTFLSADGNATFTYPSAVTAAVSFLGSDDSMTMIAALAVPDADPVAQASPEVILTPLVPAVPAVPDGTLVSADGTGTYTYPRDGTFTIRYVPDDHNYEATTSFVSHTSIPYVITATPIDNKVSLALDITCGGTYYFGDAVAEVPPVLGEDGVTVITPGVPAIPEGTLETTDGTGLYAYRAAGTYTITFNPNELSKPVTTTATVTDPVAPINYILNVAMDGLVANVAVTK